MRRLKTAGLVLLILSFVVGAVLFAIGRLKPRVAGVYINTNPSAGVFIDGQQAGRTPFREPVDPGEAVIKLVPDSYEKPLAPYETKVRLISGVETVIRYDFGESDDASSGEIISFEKIDNSETSLVVVSTPESAQLTIDGFQKAVTPYKTSSIMAGDHTLVLTSEGFVDRQIDVKVHKGYKLTAVVQLAVNTEQTEEELLVEPEPTEEPKQMVEILSTPVGFLRVRAEPSTLGKEIGQVDPGKEYELVEEDEETGWYKIVISEENEATASGWISNQYAEKVEDKVTP